MRELSAGICGLVFGVGLLVSGMTNPQKVLGFLDVAGTWDPTLAFVMGAALGVNAAAFAWTRRRAKPLLAEAFALPTASAIDRRLLVGALLFGVGWGLVGLCPGPALASLLRGELPVYVFAVALVAGTWLASASSPLASRLFASLAVLVALVAAPQASAGDPFGAAPSSGQPNTTPRPLPGAPIEEIAPYLSTHPSTAAPEFRSGPSTPEDYHYLRTAPTTPEITFYRLVVRERPPLYRFEDALLPRDPLSPPPLEPRPLLEPSPQLGGESCSSAWFSDDACVLRLYTGEGRR